MFRLEPRPGNVVIVRMDDGKVNAMGPPFLAGFEKVWQDVAAQGSAVVLAGNARAFSAGLDLKALPALPLADLRNFMEGFARVMTTLALHPRPVLAAVDGPAMAGGAIFALCADLRFLSPAARLALTEMPVGIPFPPPVIELVRLSLPEQEHGPAIFEGAVRAGEAALRTGWAHACVPRERVVEDAAERAAVLASYNPRAYARAKALLRAPLAAAAHDFRGAAVDAYMADLASPETMRAITQYMVGIARRTSPDGPHKG